MESSHIIDIGFENPRRHVLLGFWNKVGRASMAMLI
jgi:hypothetical protein